MLKLKLQHFGHLVRRVDSLEKSLMLGRIGGRRRGRQRMISRWHHWLNGRESEWTLGFGDGQGGLDTGSRTQLSDLIELNWTSNSVLMSVLPKGSEPSWQTSSPNLCKGIYLYGTLSFNNIQVKHFMAQDESSSVKIIPKCILWMRGLVPFWVLSLSFFSLTDC